MNQEKINQFDEQGRAHGIGVSYYDNGQLYSKSEYRHGRQHGHWEYYCESGKVMYKGEYKNNQVIGLWYEDHYI